MPPTRYLRAQARLLRQQGLSINQIVAELHVKPETIRDWIRGLVLTDEALDALEASQSGYRNRYHAALKRRSERRNLRLVWQNEGRERARYYKNTPEYFQNDHVKACMLYWGEGRKSLFSFGFVNTDPAMIQIMLRFLRNELQLPDNKISIQVQCYQQNPEVVRQIEAYWLDLAHLPRERLLKTSLRKRKDTDKIKYPNGMCNLLATGGAVIHHVYGAIQEYAGFDRPEWLG